MSHRIVILFFFLCAFLLDFANAQTNDCLPPKDLTLFGNELYIPSVKVGGRIGTRHLTEKGAMVNYRGAKEPTAGLFDAVFMFGGIDKNGTKVTSGGNPFPPAGYQPGPLDSTVNCENWRKPFVVYKAQIENHRQDWADNSKIDFPQAAIIGWPGTSNPNFNDIHSFSLPIGELAPFVDLDADGIYEPMQGEYPTAQMLDSTIIPSELIWSIAHHEYLDVLDGFGKTKCEFQSTYYALECRENASLNNAIFGSMKVINKGEHALDSCLAAMYSNMHIGASFLDSYGTAVDLNSVYAYESTNIDKGSSTDSISFLENPPAAGLTYLNHDLYKSMYHFFGSSCNYSGMTEPTTGDEYYRYLNGRWPDNSPLLNIDHGYLTGGVPADFMFPDLPWDSTGWVYTIFNFCTGIYFIPSVYLGTIHPDESRTLDYCYSFARGDSLNHFENVQLLFENIEGYHDAYAQKFSNTCTPPTSCVDDCVWPGDANSDGRVDHLDFAIIVQEQGDEGQKRADLPTWKGHAAVNWTGENIWNVNQKHTDVNGDGVISELDKVIFEDNYLRENGNWQAKPDSFLFGEELRFTNPFISHLNLSVGESFLVRRRYFGTKPLYSLAYDIEWDTTKLELGILNLPDPNFSENSVSHFNSDSTSFQFGGLGFESANHPMRLKIKDNLPIPDSTWVRFKNIHAFDTAGNSIEVKGQFLKICIGGGCSFTSTQGAVPYTPHIFPNPSSDFFQIDSEEKVEAVRVFDAYGRLVLEKTNTQHIEVQHLPEGLYVVEIRMASGVFIEKMLKR